MDSITFNVLNYVFSYISVDLSDCSFRSYTELKSCSILRHKNRYRVSLFLHNIPLEKTCLIKYRILVKGIHDKTVRGRNIVESTMDLLKKHLTSRTAYSGTHMFNI